MGRIFKDPFTQKDDYINTQTPTVGSFAMRNPLGSENGHVGIVVGVSGDSVLIKDSNGVKGKDGKYNETVSTRSVPLNSILASGGFFDPTKAQGTGATGQTGLGDYKTY